MHPTVESLLLLGGVFAGVVAAAHLLKRRSAPSPLSVTCPRCGVTQIGIRKPANLRQFLWGGYTCPGCGAELDRWGKPVKP